MQRGAMHLYGSRFSNLEFEVLKFGSLELEVWQFELKFGNLELEVRVCICVVDAACLFLRLNACQCGSGIAGCICMRG